MYRAAINVVFVVLTAGMTIFASCFGAATPVHAAIADPRANNSREIALSQKSFDDKLLSLLGCSHGSQDGRDRRFARLTQETNSFGNGKPVSETETATGSCESEIMFAKQEFIPGGVVSSAHSETNYNLVRHGMSGIGSLATALPFSAEQRQDAPSSINGVSKKSVVQSSGFNLFFSTDEKVPGMILDPEPAMLLLLGSSLIFVAGVGRRKFARK